MKRKIQVTLLIWLGIAILFSLFAFRTEIRLVAMGEIKSYEIASDDGARVFVSSVCHGVKQGYQNRPFLKVETNDFVTLYLVDNQCLMNYGRSNYWGMKCGFFLKNFKQTIPFFLLVIAIILLSEWMNKTFKSEEY